jgi:hypothetical protein
MRLIKNVFGTGLIVAVISIAIWGCGSDSSGQQSHDLPEETSEVTYSLPATTKLISHVNEASVLAVEDDGATIVLEADSELGASLSAGDVLMFGITSQTPNGLLRKVSSKSSSPQGVVLLTDAASLPEAFEELDLRMVRSLPYEEMESYDTTLEGLEVRRYPLSLDGDASGKFEMGFDGTVLYDDDGDKDTTYDQVVADGSISFSVGVTLEAKIEWFSLKRVKVGAAVSQDGELTLTSTLPGLKFAKEVALGQMYFAPLVVGPVVITPKLELILGATGDLEVQVKASVSEHISAEAGAVFLNGIWTPYSSIDSDWNFEPPTVTASAKLKAYVGPKISLMLYGVAGPHAQVTAYVDLSADISKTPWWELYVGIEGSLGIEGEILGYELFEFQLDGIVDFRKLLAQADDSRGCVPDCSGLECGQDPVCFESCGSCGGGESCQGGQCVQGGPNCPADKDCSGLECGQDPVCFESCGSCGGGESCQDGTCEGGTYPAQGVIVYTGSDQFVTVPLGVSEVEVKLWGAGGGGHNTADGGAGGFVSGILAVTPGETLTIVVGQGGQNGESAYGGGGATDDVGNPARGGGGRSAIRRSDTELATAGGGGGAGNMQSGGAGGGKTGQQAGPGAYDTSNDGAAGGCGCQPCNAKSIPDIKLA